MAKPEKTTTATTTTTEPATARESIDSSLVAELPETKRKLETVEKEAATSQTEIEKLKEKKFTEDVQEFNEKHAGILKKDEPCPQNHPRCQR